MKESDVHTFELNKTTRLTLSDSGLEHIFNGELSVRLVEVAGKKTGKTKKILKGGMHTVDGFLKFKSFHDKLEHLMFYNSNEHDYWYYARELQNKVINLRLPKDIFQNKAAKLTNFPDEYYKSGYLWKTLFPKGWGKLDIVNAIEEALVNIDEKATSGGEYVGYAFKDDPMKEMRICILHRDGEINSAFPSWTQPCTGNNGKPYSHFDSIGHVIAESTEFFDSEYKLNLPTNTTLLGEDLNLCNLPRYTPEFIRDRKFIDESDIDKWSNEKNYKLMEYAGNASKSDIENIITYLSDDLIVKENHSMPRDAYKYHYLELVFSPVDFNSFHLPQNIIDCLIVIGFYDSFRNTLYSHGIISYLMKNMVTHAGCLDSWNKKRILNNIIEIVLSHHDKNLAKDFLHWLADSPWKRELFIDINCALFSKLDLIPENVINDDGSLHESLCVIHSTEQPINSKINHFKYYYILNLGETYLLNFEQPKLFDFFDQHNDSSLLNYVSDSIKFTRSKDLILFSEQFNRIINHITSNNVAGLSESAILSVFKDYYRIQSAQRLRTNLYFKDVCRLEHELSVDNVDSVDSVDSVEFIRWTSLDHERQCNMFSINLFFEASDKIAMYINSKKLSQELIKQKEFYYKKRPPLPDMKKMKVL